MSDAGIVGQLFKVLRVDHDDDTIHFQTQNGQTGRASNLSNIDNVEPGDIIIVGQNSWERAPEDLWRESSQIATVRLVLDDGFVLVDGGIGSFQRVANPNGIGVKVGNVVEYNDAQGLLSVISERPIKSSLLGDDNENVESEYLRDEAGAGPTFNDFGGYPHVVARAKELIETQLERQQQLENIGARPIKGILFTGQPGTGKTHLARIIARESNAQFYAISGPEIISKWLGDTEGTLRKIFEAATNSDSGRAIVFFDEIDSIAEKRSADSHEASKRLVAQLLTLMDGFDNKGKSVIVIAATNRVDSLDPALTRPGRFDWEIEFGLPTRSDRYEILKVAGAHLKTAADLPLEDVAALTEGWSAAELTFIWTEAALLAVGDGREEVAPEDFVQAFERIALRPRRSVVAEVAA
ncbi:ATP-binding protein [Tessaracoccus lacteus]|uniref:AAA family ATPase n=1 Tax=Tessaracoccus lacteus TaxID=3041766 RepID=A0ABY8PWB5_9ACTN|nr:AAA family ATPase [Tessaracoccus sp. T21]WGT46739.1 AAA family ATPase [Tessaracoccus sp. T21]